VTAALSAKSILLIVVRIKQTTTGRRSLQIRFLGNPEKPHKTQENQEIPAERPALPVEICSAHENTLERAGTQMADSREVMNIRQASQYLGVSPDTLYKYVNEQKLPAFKLGNRWRFKKSKLDQWMEEKSMETEPHDKKKIKAAVKAAGTP